MDVSFGFRLSKFYNSFIVHLRVPGQGKTEGYQDNYFSEI